MVIVVGAGLTGCVIARVLAEHGQRVELHEKSRDFGGAIADVRHPEGYFVHTHGPHIFHTNSEEAYRFLSRFTGWTDYRHNVLGSVGGVLCPIPFNFASIDAVFDPALARTYKTKLKSHFGGAHTLPIQLLATAQDDDLKRLADFIYENVFLHYTIKQWGMRPEALGGDVMKRVPIRLSYEDGYFADAYQGMPVEGYTAMLGNLLAHPGITLVTGSDAAQYTELRDGQLFFKGVLLAGAMAYTGPADQLLQQKHGMLPYRSLRFAQETTPWSFQPAAVVNYPNAPEITRITEYGHFYPGKAYTQSVIVREYPLAYAPDVGLEPYYPIPIPENEARYQLYVQEAAGCGNLFLAGRLGHYRYLNMDAAVLDGLETARKILATLHS